LDPASAEGIIEAATSEGLNPPLPPTSFHLRSRAPAPEEATPIHMNAEGTETLAHQEEVLKIVQKHTIPNVEATSSIHMIGGTQAHKEDQVVDKMKVIKENEVLQQAVTMARSDAQRLFLSNQKYTATLEAADTRTEHWKALLGRMKGTFKAQEDNLKVQIAHLDQKCKEVEEIKGVPDKITENFDALKSKEQAVLEDVPLAPEKDCRVKSATFNKHRTCRSFSKKTNIGRGSPDDPKKVEECKELCKHLGNKYRFSVGRKGQCKCCNKDGDFKRRPKGKWRTYKAKNCR